MRPNMQNPRSADCNSVRRMGRLVWAACGREPNYQDNNGRHELVALLDQLSLTYSIIRRGRNGWARRLKAQFPSLAAARRWSQEFCEKTHDDR